MQSRQATIRRSKTTVSFFSDYDNYIILNKIKHLISGLHWLPSKAYSYRYGTLDTSTFLIPIMNKTLMYADKGSHYYIPNHILYDG